MSEQEFEEQIAEAEEGAAAEQEQAEPDESSEVPEGVDPETGELIEEPEGALSDATLASMSARDRQRVIERGTMTEAEVGKALDRFEASQAQILDKLQREGERHRNRLAEIVQEDILACVPCPLCRPDFAGWLDTRAPLDEETKALVRVQIGDRQPENWQQDPFSAQCGACKGLGEVLTGSQKQGQTQLPCVPCGGKGWVPTEGSPRKANVVQLTTPTAGYTPAEAPAVAPDLSEVPEWVRERFLLMPKAGGA